MSEPAITVRNISKDFGSVRAVEELSFDVPPASCFGMLGPNGAGKTTMMRMIYAKTLRNRDCDGTIDVFGYDPRTQELDIKYLAGVVPQENNLDDELNVRQNLFIYSRFYNIPTQQARQRIDYLLEFMELTERANAKIRELSGGMQRRLTIARALINQPRLLILDEPTTGLDPQVRHLIWDKLRQLKTDGTTILLTTHYMEEAYQICDEILIMHKGRKVMQGSPQDLLRSNIEPYVLEVLYWPSLQERIEKSLLEHVRIDRTHDLARIYADKMDTLTEITNHLKDGRYHLRQSNLEDVFMKATGSTLNAGQ